VTQTHPCVLWRADEIGRRADQRPASVAKKPPPNAAVSFSPGDFAPLASLDWQVHVYGTAAAALREFAAGIKLPLHEWPWTPAARRAGLERDATYLVRPDGHVGFARLEPDVEGLRDYLGRFGIVGT
jgi:hypothetical protein